MSRVTRKETCCEEEADFLLKVSSYIGIYNKYRCSIQRCSLQSPNSRETPLLSKLKEGAQVFEM